MSIAEKKHQLQLQLQLYTPISHHDLPIHIATFLDSIQAYSTCWTPVFYCGEIYLRNGNFFIALDEPCELQDDGVIIIDV